MLNWIIHFLKGYLLIEIKGNALERFINQIINEKINLWEIERRSKDNYRAKINIRDFNRLRPLVKKRMCTVTIIRKCGLPFILLRSKRRSFLLLGFSFFLLILWIGSSFLWFIELKGLERLPETRVIQLLDSAGVKVGKLKAVINLEQVETFILQQEPTIAWLDLTWEGTRLNLKLVEKKIVERSFPGNIISEKDGVITEIIALKGFSTVKEGDTVTAGQTLIIAPAAEDNGQQPARGIVRAYVWYEGVGEADILYKEAVYTGRKKQVAALKVGSYLIKQPLKISFQDYIVHRVVKTIPGWRNLRIPIEFIKEEYKEVNYLVEDRGKEVALFIAKERAMENVLQQIPADAVILDIKVSELQGIEDDNQLQVKILLKTEEDICTLRIKDEEDLSDRD